jgi:CO/xanthine dehydrogenase Mo-binding subunit
MHTSLAQIVAEELGVPPEKVTVEQGDTDTVPYTVLSAGSMATVSAGSAAYRAARVARERLLKAAAEILEVPETDLEIGDECVRVIGASESISLAELAIAVLRTPEGPISGQWVLGTLPRYPSYSVDIVTVEVDPETGQVRILDVVAGQDVGRALNPTLVEGQMEGGVVQGLGFGMMEGYRHDGEGHVLNPNFLNYPLPTSADIPGIRTVMVEEPAPDGPYGGKGVGEPPIIPGAAALANAIHDAVGVRVTELPITPERVLAAIRAKNGE